jgi:Ca2+-binding RTX toxin-like protein
MAATASSAGTATTTCSCRSPAETLWCTATAETTPSSSHPRTRLSHRTLVLDGGAGNDRLVGCCGGSDSVLRGGPGADELLADGFRAYGGSGPDTIRGHSFPLVSDEMFGGPGDDTLSGLAGNDYLSGGRGNDHLSGGSGNDRLRGRAGNDTLNGNRARDVLRGGLGRDTNTGGVGTDFCRSPSSGPRAHSCER